MNIPAICWCQLAFCNTAVIRPLNDNAGWLGWCSSENTKLPSKELLYFLAPEQTLLMISCCLGQRGGGAREIGVEEPLCRSTWRSHLGHKCQSLLGQQRIPTHLFLLKVTGALHSQKGQRLLKIWLDHPGGCSPDPDVVICLHAGKMGVAAL